MGFGKRMGRRLQLAADKYLPKRKEGWISWDTAPWRHPWLTPQNLSEVAEFSRFILSNERHSMADINIAAKKIAFLGNIANTMYMRAVPLRRLGLDISIFIHPDDSYIMSYPEWEESDIVVDSGETSYLNLKDRFHDAVISKVFQVPGSHDEQYSADDDCLTTIYDTYSRVYPSYMYYAKMAAALRAYDVIWGTQCAYVALLAQKPYVVSQYGGDAWFEASRSDELGRITRAAFTQARIWLVSNPWSFAHARRLGLKNLVYLPKILDEIVYAPGDRSERARWSAEVGGDFFVLTSSRLDEMFKRSSIALDGFAAFSRQYPGARLIAIGWGKDKSPALERISSLGLQDKVLFLPLSSKGRLRRYLKSADAFLDQFVLGYFGSAGLEAMACGLPVIGRLEMAQYAALSETGPPPVLNAENAEMVGRHLYWLSLFPERRRALAEASRAWFLANHSAQRWATDHIAVLAATATGAPAPDWQASPLASPLSAKERRYHRAGLRAAPPFPSYTI